jgi:predicted oxidoreductase
MHDDRRRVGRLGDRRLHADIYARGKSESVFGEYLIEHKGLRESITIQTKCGIRFPGSGEGTKRVPTRYDFSYEHIVGSAEESLRRLAIEQIDTLLLHRPDPLVEPDEVARAFADLRKAGKVREFGVSNHSAAQIELLSASLDRPLVANQMEVSLLHPDLVAAGTAVNQRSPSHVLRDEGTIEYCRRTGITVQAWSPLAKGRLSGRDVSSESQETRDAAQLIAQFAREKGVPGEAIVLAWVLRHPAPILPVVGTTNPERIAASAQADATLLTREEWYLLLEVARGMRMP